MTHYFDLVPIPGIQASSFIGDLGHVDDWGQVLADVARNGKFDYAVDYSVEGKPLGEIPSIDPDVVENFPK